MEQNIVILQSDKGNSLVVLAIQKYFSFGHEFFNSNNFIRCINENETKFNQLQLYFKIIVQ